MHIYKCENGLEVPSVTTILKVLGSEAIIHWANWLGFKHIRYEEELQNRADNGTIIHSCVQAVVDSSISPPQFINTYEKEYYEKITNKFKDFISKYHYETYFTEKSFASEELGYGGTIDWFVKIAGLNVLVDFKSSKEVRLKHLLQLGGYMGLLEKNGYRVDAGAIIIINSKNCLMYPINKQAMVEMLIGFNKIFEAYKVDKTEIPNMDTWLLNKLKEDYFIDKEALTT